MIKQFGTVTLNEDIVIKEGTVTVNGDVIEVSGFELKGDLGMPKEPPEQVQCPHCLTYF